MKKQHYILPIVLLLASVFCRLRAEAQCSNYVNNASTTFSLPSEFTNGKSFSVTDEISVCAGLALSSTTVEVSAAGNLTNGSNSIALSKFTFFNYRCYRNRIVWLWLCFPDHFVYLLSNGMGAELFAGIRCQP